MQALGMIETRGLIAAVESADAMLKSAEVTLLEKTYVGGGLATISVTGDVGAVKAAVEAGAAAVRQINGALLVSQHVIPRPHEELNTLIVPIKPLKKVEFDNAAPIEDEAIAETEIADIAAENSIIEDSILEEAVAKNTLSEASISEKAMEKNTVSEDTVVNEYPKAKESISPEFNLDKINKEFIDKTVVENGLEKAIEILNRLKVTKLRNLARGYKNMRIAGRNISKADKKMLIEEFKEYYGKIL